jgi:hypothetical protein
MNKHPDILDSFTVAQPASYDPLQFARKIQGDLKVLAAVLRQGYKDAQQMPSTAVQQSLLQMLTLCEGSEALGTVLNPPILTLEALVTRARHECARRDQSALTDQGLTRVLRDVEALEKASPEAILDEVAAEPRTPAKAELTPAKTTVTDLGAFRARRATSGSIIQQDPSVA